MTAGAELYREKQETRDFIERAIPSIEYGKVNTTFSDFQPNIFRVLESDQNFGENTKQSVIKILV